MEQPFSASRSLPRNLAVDAAGRVQRAGAQYSTASALAALELIDSGTAISVSSKERGALRQRLPALSAADLAYRVTGLLGTIVRYEPHLGEEPVARLGTPIAGSRLDPAIVSELGLPHPPTGPLIIHAPSDVTRDEASRAGLVQRDDGQIGIVTGGLGDGMARSALDVYLLGDAASSAAAAAWLERRLRAIAEVPAGRPGRPPRTQRVVAERGD